MDSNHGAVALCKECNWMAVVRWASKVNTRVNGLLGSVVVWSVRSIGRIQGDLHCDRPFVWY